MTVIDQPMPTHDSGAIMSDLARRIRAARAYADKSQEQMAELLGVSPVTYKRIERGVREVTTRELQRISEICQMPAEFFTADLDSLADSTAERGELEQMRSSIQGLIHRLEDIEYRMRKNVEPDE